MDNENASFPEATRPFSETGGHLVSDGTHAAVLRHAIRQLDLQPGEAVLDVCAGKGSNIEPIARQVGDEGVVIGIELSRGMMKLAEKRLGKQSNVVLVRGDITEVKDYFGLFDKALISFCFHSMHLARRTRVLESVRNMLKNGGIVLIVDYNGTLRDLKSILSEGGFTRVEYVPLFHDSLLLVKATKSTGDIGK
jgi:demethylmenaquinone methyltransferase / 2-methoxy-6-polyprenyl-1,4-benzoquinol methylase